MANWTESIKLVKTLESGENSQDSTGAFLNTKTYREIFANIKSIRQAEYYQANAIGIQPAFMFEIRFCEYEGERLLVHNDIEYNIIRTYTKNREIIELVCTKFIADEV